MTALMLGGTGPAFTDKKPIEDYEVGIGTTFGTAAANAFDNSIISDLFRAGRNVDLTANMAASVGDPRDAAAIRRAVVDMAGGTIDAATARKRAADAGVEVTVPDEGMPQADFETMLALRKRQKRDAVMLSRRPQTWAGWGAETAGMFAGSAADPINVASAFIPLVGEARYGVWLERAGSGFFARAGVRARAGVIEGVGGAAVVEPFNLALNRTYEPDYGLSDSFLNVAFGGVLGGGLHVMGGAGFDLVSRDRRAAGRAPEHVSREALAEAVTAVDNGRRVDVAGVFRKADPLRDPLADTRFLSLESARAIDVADADVERALQDIQAIRAGVTERPADLVETIKGMGGIRLTDNAGNITSEGGDVRAIFDKRYPPGLVNNKNGVPLDTVRERLQEEGWLRPWDGQGENPTSINDVLDLLTAWKGGKKPVKLGEGPVEDLTPVREEVKAAGIAKSDSEDVAAFKLARHRAEQAYAESVAPELRDPAIEPDVFDPTSDYEPADMAELRSQADEAVSMVDDGSDLDGEVEALGEYLNMARAYEKLDAADESVLALADEFTAKAERSGRAYKAAAACLSGLA